MLDLTIPLPLTFDLLVDKRNSCWSLTWISPSSPPVLSQREPLGLQEEALQHHHLRGRTLLLWNNTTSLRFSRRTSRTPGAASHLRLFHQQLPVFVDHVFGALQQEVGHGVELFVHCWEKQSDLVL